ncbi:hypothetical protein ASD88_22270 [Pelomonas sp. Root662]|nr:hypothetical protein ASC81_20685 [Pelomonas sp. Root405]KRA68155.1 hypothetical protein ASD88_22270 [Pelomonas sp. Root662]
MVAAALGAMLMAAFINTLQENVRQGEQLRQAQRAGNVRHAIGMAANMAPRNQSPQLGTSMSPTFQR